MDTIPTNGTTQRNIEQRLRELIEGRSNAVGPTVTLTAGATSTTVSKTTINANAAVFLFPTTANAATALATTYALIMSGGGAFTVTHANNAQTDRTFYYAVLGG